jgi:hypothetical protein
MTPKEIALFVVIGALVFTAGGVVIGLMRPPTSGVSDWRIILVLCLLLAVVMSYMLAVASVVRWFLR